MLWCAEKLKVQMKDACTDVDTAAGEHCEVIECLEAITALAEGAEGDCAEHLPDNTAVGLRAVSDVYSEGQRATLADESF